MMMKKLNKKKKGFTLIELIAVIAIIGILAAVLVPRVSGYINEAKKTKVITQARTVIMAVEGYKAKKDVATDPTGAVSGLDEAVKTATGSSEADFDTDTSSVQNLTVAQCKSIVNDGVNFEMTNGVVTKVGDTTITAPAS